MIAIKALAVAVTLSNPILLPLVDDEPDVEIADEGLSRAIDDVDAVEAGMLVGNRYSLLLLTCVDVVVNVVTVIPILSVDEYVSVVVAVVFVVNDNIEGLVIVVDGLSQADFLLPLDSLCVMGRHSLFIHFITVAGALHVWGNVCLLI
uniref:Uncharacterized protein n=1 Tax=Glossina austeni TaxID=7395 RepID=A0A1A9UIK8_GLOAU